MSYKHLSLEERHYITTSLKIGKSQNSIAEDLNRSQSTISKEIKKNTGKRGYRYIQANTLANERKTKAKKYIKLSPQIVDKITEQIIDDWSPEQITGRLDKEKVISLHHETIYRYILKNKKAGGDLYTHLRHQNKTYRKRYGSKHCRSGIPNRVDIDNRPKVANERKRLGDWEADTIIGHNHKGAILTLDERQTKIRIALPLDGKRAKPVTDGIITALGQIKDLVKSITFDNGKEFTGHEVIAKALGCKTYFAKPYHSWERGQNENANGLLRQYFPKAIELINISMQKVLAAVDKLNNRPRKCLQYLTPYELFEKKTGLTRNDIMGYALNM